MWRWRSRVACAVAIATAGLCLVPSAGCIAGARTRRVGQTGDTEPPEPAPPTARTVGASPSAPEPARSRIVGATEPNPTLEAPAATTAAPATRTSTPGQPATTAGPAATPGHAAPTAPNATAGTGSIAATSPVPSTTAPTTPSPPTTPGTPPTAASPPGPAPARPAAIPGTSRTATVDPARPPTAWHEPGPRAAATPSTPSRAAGSPRPAAPPPPTGAVPMPPGSTLPKAIAAERRAPPAPVDRRDIDTVLDEKLRPTLLDPAHARDRRREFARAVARISADLHVPISAEQALRDMPCGGWSGPSCSNLTLGLEIAKVCAPIIASFHRRRTAEIAALLVEAASIHSIWHDAYGYVRRIKKKGPGYTYAGCLFSRCDPKDLRNGQVDGLLYQVSRLLGVRSGPACGPSCALNDP